MPEINNEYYFPPILDLEDDENEKVPGDDDPTEYLSDGEDVSDTEDVIPTQDQNLLGGKILAVWESYKPLLEHDYSRAGYMLSMDVKKYAYAQVSVLYIYVNYHVILLQFIII